MPFEAACVLIRRFDDHVKTFAVCQLPVAHAAGWQAGTMPGSSDLGLQISRSFGR
jgi:hypothetical protein